VVKGYDWVLRQVEWPRRWLACLVIGWSCARKGEWVLSAPRAYRLASRVFVLHSDFLGGVTGVE
jgi:hypothetical protein